MMMFPQRIKCNFGSPELHGLRLCHCQGPLLFDHGSHYKLTKKLRLGYDTTKMRSRLLLPQHRKPQNSVPARISNIQGLGTVSDYFWAPKLSSAACRPTLTVPMVFPNSFPPGQWRRQLWGTGARASLSLSFQQFHF